MQMQFQIASRATAENHRPAASSYSIVTKADLSKGHVLIQTNGVDDKEAQSQWGGGGEKNRRRHERQVVVSDRRIGGKATQRASESSSAVGDPPRIGPAVHTHGERRSTQLRTLTRGHLTRKEWLRCCLHLSQTEFLQNVSALRKWCKCIK